MFYQFFDFIFDILDPVGQDCQNFIFVRSKKLYIYSKLNSGSKKAVEILLNINIYINRFFLGSSKKNLFCIFYWNSSSSFKCLLMKSKEGSNSKLLFNSSRAFSGLSMNLWQSPKLARSVAEPISIFKALSKSLAAL